MRIAYLDTGVIIKRYIKEKGSRIDSIEILVLYIDGLSRELE